MSRYSNIETSLAMSTLATWSHVVQSRDVSPHNFDGLAMSGLAFSVAPHTPESIDLKFDLDDYVGGLTLRAKMA